MDVQKADVFQFKNETFDITWKLLYPFNRLELKAGLNVGNEVNCRLLIDRHESSTVPATVIIAALNTTDVYMNKILNIGKVSAGMLKVRIPN